jgi:hypothetical protein
LKLSQHKNGEKEGEKCFFKVFLTCPSRQELFSSLANTMLKSLDAVDIASTSETEDPGSNPARV